MSSCDKVNYFSAAKSNFFENFGLQKRCPIQNNSFNNLMEGYIQKKQPFFIAHNVEENSLNNFYEASAFYSRLDSSSHPSHNQLISLKTHYYFICHQSKKSYLIGEHEAIQEALKHVFQALSENKNSVDIADLFMTYNQPRIALKLYKSATKGEETNAKACFLTGLFYYSGKLNVNKDYDKAKNYFQLASVSQSEDADSMKYKQLASCFLSGVGEDLYTFYRYFKENPSPFFEEEDLYKLLINAADKKYVPAQFDLACILEEKSEDRRHIEQAKEYFEALAINGHAAAQYRLARMLYKERSDVGTLNKVEKWLENSAEQGYIFAQYHLGNLLYIKKRNQEDLIRAQHLLLNAAGQGYAKAKYKLAQILCKQGDSESLRLAKILLRNAANQGYTKAQNKLALIQEKEQQKHRKPEEMKVVSQQNSCHKNISVRLNLDFMFEESTDIQTIESENLEEMDMLFPKTVDSIYPKISSEPIIEDNFEEYVEFDSSFKYKISCVLKEEIEKDEKTDVSHEQVDQKNELTNLDLVESTESIRDDLQQNVSQNKLASPPKKSFEELEKEIISLEKAADRGDIEAMYKLGILLENEGNGGLDSLRASYYYDMAANRNHTGAQCNLGVMLLRKQGRQERDVEAAKNYLDAAAAKGSPLAKYNLAIMHVLKELKSSDPIQARLLMKEAANNYSPAQYEYGYMLEIGFGGPKDLVEAKKQYQKAAETGDEKALKKLEELSTKEADKGCIIS